MAKRVSIINFKGGVGKTTLAFHLATGLTRYYPGTRVLMVDIDHQSSVSIVCLGGEKWQEASTQNRTVDQVFRHFTTQGIPIPGREIICMNPLREGYPLLDLVAATLNLDNIEIELAATLRGNPIASEWDKRTLLCRWIDDTGIDDYYDYVIFDCPPATKIVSQNAIAASHGYILPVVPEAVMQRGAQHLVGMIETGIDRRLDTLQGFGNPTNAYVSPTAHIGVVITRIRTHGPAYSGYTDDHTVQLESLERTWGNLLVAPYIEDGTGISQCLSDGIPVYDRPNAQNVGGRGFPQMFRQLVTELKRRIDGL
jgi:chromosome partitioning protein